MLRKFALCLLAFSMSLPLMAQQEPTLDAKAIQDKLKQLEDDKSIADDQRQRIAELYKRALEQLAVADSWNAKSKGFENTIQNVPDRLKSIREKVESIKSSSEFQTNIDEMSLTQVESSLAQAEVEFAEAIKESNELQEESKRWNERRAEIPKTIAAAQKNLDEVNQKLNATTEAPESAELIAARRTSWLATRLAIQQQIAAYEREIASYDARAKLLNARRDLAVNRANLAEKKVHWWREAVNRKRRQEAEEMARRAREERLTTAKSHLLVRRIAESNSTLAELRIGPDGLIAKIEEITAAEGEIDKKLLNLEKQFASLRERVKIVGMTNAIGLFLRKKSEELPDVEEYRRKIELRQQEMPDIQLKIIEFEEQRDYLLNIEQSLRWILSRWTGPLPENGREELEAVIREQLLTRRNYLEQLLKDYNTYFVKLVDLDAKERRFVAVANSYKTYIEERILWVQSCAEFQGSDFYKSWQGAGWLLSPENWREVWRALTTDLSANPQWWMVPVLLIGLLIYARRTFPRRLHNLAGLIMRARTDNFHYTVMAFFLTLVHAVIWPCLIWFVAWRLGTTGYSLDFPTAVAGGLYAVSMVYLMIAFWRTICTNRGMGESHFRWPGEATKIFSRNLLALMLAILPIVFIVAVTSGYRDELWRNSLGRLSFCLGMSLLAVFFYNTFRPSGGAMRQILRRHQQGWPDRWRYVWFAPMLLIPLGLAALAAFGYYYTAVQLTRLLWKTLVLAVVVLFGYAMALRWLFFLHRTLIMIKARSLREAKADEKEPSESALEIQKAPTWVEEDVNFPKIMIQARAFLRTMMVLTLFVGVWFIWNEVLPALNILKRIELWRDTVKVAEEVVRSDGTTATQLVDREVVTTLSDVFFALMTLLVTFVATRNLPGIIEMSILQRVKADKGMRYAISTLVRYSIIAIGFIVALKFIGADWNKMLWITTAFTVALGFGLQDIFANFISGLILLFERPIRVGDTVTIGDANGTVSRIQIRATTIVDWDRKELVIPNKELIVGRVINWTLSDPVLRIVIPVGVAYGSNTDLVEEQLLQAARENPHVLADPQPHAVFRKFGESALDFELRVFVPSIDVYLRAIHSLQMAIDKAFRKAGIEIAFPQRDIHIRTPGDLSKAAHLNDNTS